MSYGSVQTISKIYFLKNSFQGKSMEENEGKLWLTDLNYRLSLTKVRGGWTKAKIKKELKNLSSIGSLVSFYREIAKYDSPKDFEKNLFYHGSGGGISQLKPSIVLSDTASFGGGYGEKYWGISLSKDRDMASNFTGQSNFGTVAAVLIKRNAIIKEMPNIEDAAEIEDIIEELWNEGVDAVKIGNHNDKNSEKEIVILNPRCIVVGEKVSFKVYQKPKIPSLDAGTIENMWIKSATLYREGIATEFDEKNSMFLEKYGRELDPDRRFPLKTRDLVAFHENNVKNYLEQKVKNKTCDLSLDNYADRCDESCGKIEDIITSNTPVREVK